MERQSKRRKLINPEGRHLIVVLEGAQLEVGKVGRQFELLASDKHATFLKKLKKDPNNYRPDITHQCLLMLLDSPLNKLGFLKIYIHTAKNTLIEIHPQTRIPRTYDRFAGLIVQLLLKQSIKASETSQTLMKVIKNPVEDRFPTGCVKYATSCHVLELTNFRTIVPPNDPVVIVIGAVAHGQVKPAYCEKVLKISNYPLSAALVCAKVCTAFEEVWDAN